MFTLAHDSRRGRPMAPGRQQGLLARLTAGHRMRREVRALTLLDERLLTDIGLTRADAEALAGALDGLPRWDAPAHWRA